jgi:hypothetical protein
MGVPAPDIADRRPVLAAADFVSQGGRELWFLRAAAAVPLWRVAAGLAVFLAGTAWLIAALDPSAQGVEARLPYTLSLAIALIIPIGVWALRKSQEDLDALRPLWLGTSEAFAGVRGGLARLPVGVIRTATLVGAANAFVTQELVFGRLSRFLGGELGLAAVWQLSMAMLLWGIIFPAVVLSIRNALVFGRVGSRGIGVAIFEAERGLPLARLGMRTLVLWLGMPMALGSIAVVSGAADPRVLLGMGSVYTLGSAFCLLVPTAGLRVQIRRKKQQELERIARALSGERDAMLGSVLGKEAPGFDRLHLLQWRGEVEGFREWPLDAPHLRRFALFVALPLLSWIAAALVERGLDVLLDR